MASGSAGSYRHLSLIVSSLLYCTILISCSKGKNDDGILFEKLDPGRTGIWFSNELLKSDSLNLYEFDPFYNGGGVAVGDINNDGLSDLYFSGNMKSGKLYLNKGDFHFEDITASAGIITKDWARGVAMADVNGDGYIDIYVCISGGENRLYINQGDKTFLEQAKSYGLNDNGWATHAAFLDYDLDGDLDMYLITRTQELLRFSTVDPKPRKGESENTDKLYKNNGNNTFTDVTAEAGLDFKGNGLGIVITDVNNDFWPDIYIANDQVYNDFLYINTGDGKFTDAASSYFKSQSFSGMGTDAADFNNDGLVDICVVDMFPESFEGQTLTIGDMRYDRFNRIIQNGYIPQYQRNVLQLNNGDGTFSEIAQLSGIDKTDWSWGVLFADFDNNGYKDIVVSTGMVKSLNNLDYIMYNRPTVFQANDPLFKKRFLVEMERLPELKIPNRIFSNKGDLTFLNQTHEWGLGERTFSYGVAYADLDNDGDLDLVFSNVNDYAGLYKNTSERKGKSFIRVEISGVGSNTAGLGAKVYLYNKGKVQYQEVSPFRGYQSTVENIIHFGLDDVSKVDSLIVIWPDKSYTIRRAVTADQVLTMQPEEKMTLNRNTQAIKPVFEKAEYISFQHQDIAFNDFAYQGMLPHGLSEYGPPLSAADINADGYEDIYVGGGRGQSGKFFIQQNDGSFLSKEGPVDKDIQETSALLRDFNNDGLPDLYICAGGSGIEMKDQRFEDMLFYNNGMGTFVLAEDALPSFPYPSTVVAGGDFDNDGDLDLFVGGGTVAKNYPNAAPSRILRNERGKFLDVTKEIAPHLDTLGLVTDAEWTDFDEDGLIDLVVASEWNPVYFFKNHDGSLKNITPATGINHLTGWWQSLAIVDVDNDGHKDVVAGNYGKNSRLQPSVKEPVKLLINDFDSNGSIDPVLFSFVDGIQRPVHTRDRISDQMPMTKKRYGRYTSFTAATFETFNSFDTKQNASTRTATTFSSGIFYNHGDGTFTFGELPIESQLAPIKAIITDDVNKDGVSDLILAGNSEATDVFLGYQNAGFGCILIGQGNGSFIPAPNKDYGYSAGGIANSMIVVKTKKNKLLIVGQYKNDIRQFIFK